MTHQHIKMMSTSAAAAGSNYTAVDSTAQELVCIGKIKTISIQDKNINWKINQDELLWRNTAPFYTVRRGMLLLSPTCCNTAHICTIYLQTKNPPVLPMFILQTRHFQLHI